MPNDIVYAGEFPEGEDPASFIQKLLSNNPNVQDVKVDSYSEPRPKIVYLAGPIEADYLAGQKDGAPYSVVWRKEITKLFAEAEELQWDIRDPTTGKINSYGQYEKTVENSINFNSWVVVKTDTENVEDCDLFICNLLEGKVSIGTMIEVGIAFANRKFIIFILPEDDTKFINHPFIREMGQIFVNSVEEAFKVSQKLCLR